MLPQISATKKKIKEIRAFSGYDPTDGCGADGLFDCLNTCSDAYPCLGVREKRGIYCEVTAGDDGEDTYVNGVLLTNADGITGAAAVDGKIVLFTSASVYYDGQALEGVTLTRGRHTAVAFGRGFFILPENILVTVTDGGVSVSQTDAPVMDFAVCRGNRIFGCRFGENADGDTVNEIYVSKQGDAASWQCFDGISTDSYCASLGVPGAFTGAGVCGDTAVFFKEDAVITVRGDCPEEFSVECFKYDGAEKGAEKSVVNVGDSLFYKSRGGICVWDGVYVRYIRGGPKTAPYTDICAGAAENKYYIAMAHGGEKKIYVYDTLSGLWHIENCPGTEYFVRLAGALLMLNCPLGATPVRAYSFAVTDVRFAPQGLNIYTGQAGRSFVFHAENDVSWYAVTGRIYSSYGKNMRLREIRLAVNTLDAASLTVQVLPDGESADAGRTFSSPGGGLMKIKCRVGAADFVRVKISGTAPCPVLNMTLIYEEVNKR